MCCARGTLLSQNTVVEFVCCARDGHYPFSVEVQLNLIFLLSLAARRVWGFADARINVHIRIFVAPTIIVAQRRPLNTPRWLRTKICGADKNCRTGTTISKTPRWSNQCSFSQTAAEAWRCVVKVTRWFHVFWRFDGQLRTECPIMDRNRDKSTGFGGYGFYLGQTRENGGK